MSGDKRVFHLVHAQARQRAQEAVRTAADGFVVTIAEPTRSLEQNALLHALFSDIAQRHEWMGRKLAPEQWKVLFVSGHAVATKQGADVVPGLEGEFVNIRESTARMSKARLSSLVEYVQAWAAEHEVGVSS